MARELLTAIMRQSWYETARKRLNDVQRLRLYEIIYDYEFYGIEPSLFSGEDTIIAVVFDMVKDDIQRDREKALTIRERNRQNGQHGGRPKKEKNDQENPKPKETQENPKNPIGNSIHNTIIHNNFIEKDLKKEFGRIGKGESKEPTENEVWRIKLHFFGLGCQNPLFEYERFIEYYRQNDYRDRTGKPIENFYKLAQHWNPKNPNEKKAAARAFYYDFILKCGLTEDVFFIQFVAMTKQLTENQTIIRITQATNSEISQLIENKYIDNVRAYLRSITDTQHPAKLYYNIFNPQRLPTL